MVQPDAGILLVELNCDNGAGRCEHAYVLLQSGGKPRISGGSGKTNKPTQRRQPTPSLKTYSDGGGRREPSDVSPSHTASRKMREDSAGLIAISPEYLKDTLTFNVGGKYVCAVVATDTHIDIGLFAENRKLMKNVPWRTADGISKFYLSDLVTRSRTDTAKDIYGTEHNLSNRVQHILNGVLSMRNDSVKRINGIPLRLTVAMSPDFARGTSVYTTD